MAEQLRKLGELMFRLKWWIVAFWVVVLAVLGLVASQVGFNTTSEISIPGTKAQTTPRIPKITTQTATVHHLSLNINSPSLRS
jgi:uncharacterized membrane protein YdfJ with MMPL/SSD domain